MLTDPLWSPHWFLRNTSMTMDYCKKNITPLLTHWSYIFLALTPRHILLFETRFLLSHVNRVGMALSGCWGACIGPELAWDRCPLIHEFNWTLVQDESVSHVHFIVLGSVWPSVTVETLYNTVNFCWSTHKRHSIARPKGRDMGCLLWVHRATYCIDLSKLSSIKYLL